MVVLFEPAQLKDFLALGQVFHTETSILVFFVMIIMALPLSALILVLPMNGLGTPHSASILIWN